MVGVVGSSPIEPTNEYAVQKSGKHLVCLPLFCVLRPRNFTRHTPTKKPKNKPVLRLSFIAMHRALSRDVRDQRDIMFMLTLCMTHTVPNTRNITASTV